MSRFLNFLFKYTDDRGFGCHGYMLFGNAESDDKSAVIAEHRLVPLDFFFQLRKLLFNAA